MKRTPLTNDNDSLFLLFSLTPMLISFSFEYLRKIPFDHGSNLCSRPEVGKAPRRLRTNLTNGYLLSKYFGLFISLSSTAS